MLDLSPQQLERVCAILAEHAPAILVRAFGSRLRGTAAAHSDLDLVLKGDGPVPLEVLGRLRAAFEESDLPFRVDLVDWHRISDSFKRIIESESEAICTAAQPADEGTSV